MYFWRIRKSIRGSRWSIISLSYRDLATLNAYRFVRRLYVAWSWHHVCSILLIGRVGIISAFSKRNNTYKCSYRSTFAIALKCHINLEPLYEGEVCFLPLHLLLSIAYLWICAFQEDLYTLIYSTCLACLPVSISRFSFAEQVDRGQAIVWQWRQNTFVVLGMERKREVVEVTFDLK